MLGSQGILKPKVWAIALKKKVGILQYQTICGTALFAIDFFYRKDRS